MKSSQTWIRRWISNLVVSGSVASLGFLSTALTPVSQVQAWGGEWRMEGMAIAPRSSNATQRIEWVDSVEQALNQARAENKIVLLHFGAGYCAPCRNLEAYVFTDAKIVDEINRQFVAVKIDIQAQPELADKYTITRIPQDVFLTPDGQTVFRRLSPNSVGNYKIMLETGVRIAQQSTPQTQQVVEAMSGMTQQQWEERARSPFYGEEAAKAGTLAQRTPAQAGIPRRDGALPTASVRQSEAAAPAMFRQGTPDRESFPDHRLQEQSFPNSNFQPRSSLPPVGSPFAGNGLAGSERADARMSSQFRPGPDRDSAAAMASYAETKTREQTTINAHFISTEEAEKSLAARKVPAEVATETATIQQVSGTLDAVKSPLGLEGYCPVTLMEGQTWAKGQAEFGCYHRGVLYLFASPQARDRFMQSPDQWSPLLGGFDPVIMAEERRLEPGKRRFGVFCEAKPGQNSIVLFTSETSRDRFKADSLKYLAAIEEVTRQADRK